MTPTVSAAARRLGALILLVTSLAMAEEWTPTRAFRTFSKSNWRGLPQSSVMALAQDNDGLLWIGTLDGMATFDGKTIAPVAAVEGAPVRGIINSVIARRAGGVYVASQSGVHVFDGSAWRLVPTRTAVVSIAESRDNVLWAADGEGALWTMHGPESWRRRDEMKTRVTAVSAARDGSIWCATPDGATRIAGTRIEPVTGEPLPGRPATILAASDGRVWIATQNCTVHWTRGGADGWHQAAFEPWPRGVFRSLAEDRRGRIWAGSIGGRVAFGTADTPWTVWGPANGPFAAGVMAILGDREGTVWFGLNAVGLAQWIGEEWSHRTATYPSAGITQGFSSFGLARPLAKRGLMVGAFGSGAVLLTDDGARQYTGTDGLTEDVRAFVELEPGLLVAGTRFGIFESRNGAPFRQVMKLPSGFVMGLFCSPDGRWYAASSTAGVFVRDGGAWRADESINKSLDNEHVRGMMWRRNGELWIATLRGITIFRGNAFADHLSSRTQPAIPESVNALLEISDDEVWVGGVGGIAVRRNGKWTRSAEKDGIPGQTIYSLALDRGGAIWAGGSSGVGRFANGRWNVWDSREGLLQEESNLGGLLIDDDGSVFVSMMGGLARFDPSVKPMPRPPLHLRWVTTPRRDATGLAHIEGRDRALHLRWSAPWLGPHPVEYRVRVPRLRDTWSAPTPEDKLDVENLGAGKWRVEVAARVEGTDEWSAPLVLDVAVAPFWYETWWARLGFVALLGLLIYAAVRMRLRALRRHAAMLEATVHARTAELAQTVEQLRESEQRAQAASQAKSAFLANMSHELRTPLNGILGFAQLLARKKNRDADDQQGLAVIMSSGEHLLNLINDVLSLSKIEAGRITLETNRFDIRTIVSDVENVLRLQAEKKHLRLTIDVDETHLPKAVTGDGLRLRQILLNLLGNAVKFTESGSVSLRARWRDGRARFEIEDTGPGISAEDQQKLFQPFVQSESGQRSKEGTGLGLALSRDIARLMDGDITVESKPGVGSRFVVDVRLPEAAAETIQRDERIVAGLAKGHESARILVVDDTALNREVLVRLLAQAGFETREAANGTEALAAWREWKPQLIWIDKRMPDMDGLEVTRRIRREEAARGEHTPILALSASALEHERGEILAAGCDDFVAKPFHESTIFAKIREHLGVQYVYRERIAATETPHVLLVDDDAICRDVATEILHHNGVAVTAVASGSEALEELDGRRFDLVMIDLRMPVMSGIETTRRIRAKTRSARIPIVAMSADTFDGEPARLAEAGMDDYVTKPVEPAAVKAMLGRWLR
jgi:signal transduction histidine kinase/CheY-like chemotaxis protein/ligand-binding sensor domain-containing protein